jgi:hypothetical protein
MQSRCGWPSSAHAHRGKSTEKKSGRRSWISELLMLPGTRNDATARVTSSTLERRWKEAPD